MAFYLKSVAGYSGTFSKTIDNLRVPIKNVKNG